VPEDGVAEGGDVGAGVSGDVGRDVNGDVSRDVTEPVCNVAPKSSDVCDVAPKSLSRRLASVSSWRNTKMDCKGI
jgi:hypothetical protein